MIEALDLVLTVTHLSVVGALWIGVWRTLRRIGPMVWDQKGKQ